MHKTKKKTKTAKLPKPIKVKKEKSDEDRLPQPMTNYIDDRLEMVKQIFGSLKPKTIVNLAPDFLKVQALEEIEEACLNELLCISTKRLKSIITDTRCPSDTDSSDNDSDVERHEEHISLEEISSDSEIEGGVSKKGKKKKSSKVVDAAELKTKKHVPKTSEATAEGGQISVLELLELQARARAIRSQLALEPVTKIEVDSDEDKRNEAAAGKEITNKNDRKRLSTDKESRESAKVSKTNGSTESTQANEKDSNRLITKKFKIKRNYQSSSISQDNQDVPKQKESYREDKEKEKEKDKKSKEKRKETKKNRKEDRLNKEKTPTLKDIKKEKASRSPSPDVIPIVAEPETLLIADSSDEGDSNVKNINSSEINDKAKEPVLAESLEAESTKATPKDSKNTATAEREESDKSTDSLSKVDDEAHRLSPKMNTTEMQEEKKSKENSSNDDGDSTQDSELNKSDNNDAQLIESKKQTKKKDNVKESAKINEESNSTTHSDDDQNDDVISLGGDLETEMNEQLENEVNAIKTPHDEPAEESSRAKANKKSQEESQNEDVISLESSEDESITNNQSWHSRYMKSSKVSKVLAASRLAKRVRDKIKTSKRSKKETPRENSESEKEKTTPVFTSKHEDGSVDQYKELMEMRQRKT